MRHLKLIDQTTALEKDNPFSKGSLKATQLRSARFACCHSDDDSPATSVVVEKFEIDITAQTINGLTTKLHTPSANPKSDTPGKHKHRHHA
jgi:hypothetical protein